MGETTQPHSDFSEFERDLERVLSLVDRAELVELTQSLVRIPSVYRPGEVGGDESEVADFLQGYLEDAGFEVQREEAAPNRPNLWSVLEGDSPGRTLLFEAHTDVVTEGDAGEWTHPPFAAEVVDGFIYGRGSCDTQGNLAAAVVAVRAVKESGVDFPGRLVLCHPVDEEGMMGGIKAFIQNGHAEGVDAAVICEPEENQLCVAQKGAMRVEVVFRGKMAHGAMPLSGINPVTRAARFIVAVEELEREEIELHGRDEYLGYPSFTPTIMLGPDLGEPQINVVPASAYVALDIRTVPSQAHEDLKRKLDDILERLGAEDADFDASLSVIEERPATETARDHPVVQASASAYRRVTGGEPRYNGVPGATDGTYLKEWAGVEIVTTGAGDREMPHHRDERVSIEELYETAKLYAATAMYYCHEM